MKDGLTPDTPFKAPLWRAWGIAASIALGAFILAKAHSSIIFELRANRDEQARTREVIKELVVRFEKMELRFEQYPSKPQVESVAMFLFRELNGTNRVNEESFQRQLQLILNSK